MNYASPDALHRCDLFNLLDGQRKWDEVLSADGFSLRAEYKNSLAAHGFCSKSDLENFDFITLEARKELASERIFWRNLPDSFSLQSIALPYRSASLVAMRMEALQLINLSSELSDAEKGNILLSRIFPYRRVVSRMWQINPGLEARIRKDLINRSDDEEAVAASRNVGLDPIGRKFGLGDVKKIIKEFCQDRELATVSSKKFPRSKLVVGRILPNGLVLALVLWEVRQKSSYGGLCYSMDIGIDLITEESFLTTADRRSGVVWGGIEIGSEFFPYGLKFESVVSFYVGLAHWLRCFELLLDLVSEFFGSSDLKR